MLTPSMINNYVKDGVLPRPEKKKYSRDHLALLLVICTLKSVLSLPQIDAIIRGLTEGLTVEEQYPAFVGAHEKSLEEVTERLRSAATRDKAGKYRLAVQLALEANARRTAAARIIDSLNNSDPAPDKEKEKDKTKEK